MARSCVFCGKTPTTKEHVLAQWTRRLPEVRAAEPHTPGLKAEPHFVTRGGFTSSGMYERRLVERGRKPRVTEIQVKIVCRGCNNGWMSALEDQAIPLITSLVSGQKLTIGQDEALLLARWAVKTAVMFQYNDAGSRSVGDDIVASLMDLETPPVGFRVRLFGSANEPPVLRLKHWAGVAAPVTAFGLGAARSAAGTTVIIVGEMGLIVDYTEDAKAYGRAVRDYEGIHHLHPYVREVRWPVEVLSPVQQELVAEGRTSHSYAWRP